MNTCGQRSGNAEQVVDGALQTVQVGGGDAGGGPGAERGQGEAGRRAGGTRQGNGGHQAGAAHVAALVVVLVHADVDAEANHVRAGDVAHVLDDLRHVDGA